MYTKDQHDEILSSFREDALRLSDVSQYPLLTVDIVELAKDGDRLSEWLRMTVKKAIEAQLPVGSPIPDVTIRNSVTDLPSMGAAMLSITISPQKASPVAFPKATFRRSDKETTSLEIVNFIVGAYAQILHTLMENVNLTKLNEVLAWATSEEQADRNYKISFVPSTLRARQAGFINTINDDEIVLVADADKVFDLPNWVVLADEDPDISQQRLETSRRGLVESLIPHDTVVSALHAKIPMIRTVAGVGTHRTHTLVRNAFGRDAKGMTKGIKKPILALVETDEIIGAVEYNGENVSVVLSPVSKETLEPADFNIVELAKSYIA